MWLGGLFVPEAYITATRQFVAQANSYSLEELSLFVKVLDNNKQPATLDNSSFPTTGNVLLWRYLLDASVFIKKSVTIELL